MEAREASAGDEHARRLPALPHRYEAHSEHRGATPALPRAREEAPVGAAPPYEAASSDIDAFVVLRRRLTTRELERLRDLHRDLPLKVRRGGSLEVEYVAQDQLRPWGIHGEAASISPDEELRVGESKAV